MINKYMACQGVTHIRDLTLELLETTRSNCNAVSLYFSLKSLQKAPHISSVRVRYGVSFVTTPVTAALYATLCYIGLHYNGTRQYVPGNILNETLFQVN